MQMAADVQRAQWKLLHAEEQREQRKKNDFAQNKTLIILYMLNCG